MARIWLDPKRLRRRNPSIIKYYLIPRFPIRRNGNSLTRRNVCGSRIAKRFWYQDASRVRQLVASFTESNFCKFKTIDCDRWFCSWTVTLCSSLVVTTSFGSYPPAPIRICESWHSNLKPIRMWTRLALDHLGSKYRCEWLGRTLQPAEKCFKNLQNGRKTRFGMKNQSKFQSANNELIRSGWTILRFFSELT